MLQILSYTNTGICMHNLGSIYPERHLHYRENSEASKYRFVTNNYLWFTSVTNLINNLKWKSLQSITMIYKIRNNLVNIPCNHCLIPNTSILVTINIVISFPTHRSTATYIHFFHQPSDYGTI